MRWFRRGMWKAAIMLAGLLAFLVLMVAVPLSTSAHTRAGNVQVAPTVDVTATMTALQEEQLTLQNKQLQQSNDRGSGTWLWNNGATIVASFLSTLVVVIGALFGFRQWRTNRNDTLTKESNDSKEAQEKELRAQAEERFKAAVIALGDEKENVQVGGAILLRSFLNRDDEDIYGRYYTQIFDLAVAYLCLPRISQSSDGPDKTLPSPKDYSAPLPLTPLRQALIIVFKEAFPRARNRLGQVESSVDTRSLDASNVQLDKAFLVLCDLSYAWMLNASFRETILFQTNLKAAALANADFTKANLNNANLSAASLNNANFDKSNLQGANLKGANLRGARNLEEARNLKDADLRGVKGLTKEQLVNCKIKGAIIDEDTVITSPQSAAAPITLSQDTSAQTSSAQTSSSTPDMSGSSTSISQPSNAAQASVSTTTQAVTPYAATDGSNAADSQRYKE